MAQPYVNRNRTSTAAGGADLHARGPLLFLVMARVTVTRDDPSRPAGNRTGDHVVVVRVIGDDSLDAGFLDDREAVQQGLHELRDRCLELAYTRRQLRTRQDAAELFNDRRAGDDQRSPRSRLAEDAFTEERNAAIFVPTQARTRPQPDTSSENGRRIRPRTDQTHNGS